MHVVHRMWRFWKASILLTISHVVTSNFSSTGCRSKERNTQNRQPIGTAICTKTIHAFICMVHKYGKARPKMLVELSPIESYKILLRHPYLPGQGPVHEGRRQRPILHFGWHRKA